MPGIPNNLLNLREIHILYMYVYIIIYFIFNYLILNLLSESKINIFNTESLVINWIIFGFYFSNPFNFPDFESNNNHFAFKILTESYTLNCLDFIC